MKKYMKIMMAALTVVFLGGVCLAQDSGYIRAYNSEDAAPILKVQNTGSEKVVITWTALSNVVVIIGNTTNTTIDTGGASYDTVAELATAIAACTNSTGVKVLNVDYWCSLGTDSLTNNFAITTNTIASANHEWVTAGTWDTSTHLAFNTAIAPSDNPLVLQSIDGSVGGTGDITIDVYSHNRSDKVQTKIASWLYISPLYILDSSTAAMTNQITRADNVMPGVFNLTPLVSVSRSQGILVRASRATTATTGGVGITAAIRK